MNPATWVLVADSSRGRLYAVRGHGKPWALVNQFAHPESRVSEGGLAADQPGRTSNASGGGAHSAMESKASPKEVAFGHFAHELAAVLQAGHGQQAYERIVLVAPPHFLGLLRKTVNDTVGKRIGMTVNKDYLHLSDAELHERLDGVIAGLGDEATGSGHGVRSAPLRPQRAPKPRNAKPKR